jgi:hypothetical protein
MQPMKLIYWLHPSFDPFVEKIFHKNLRIAKIYEDRWTELLFKNNFCQRRRKEIGIIFDIIVHYSFKNAKDSFS